MIREARPTDYKAIKQLISAGVKEGSLQPRKKKEIKKSIKNGRIVVAEVEDQIVGTASVTVYDMRLAEVRSLYVTEEARGNGLAKELINGILEKPVAQLPSATLIAITQTPEVFESVGFDTSQEKRHIVFKSI